jgi:hypothetical protein
MRRACAEGGNSPVSFSIDEARLLLYRVEAIMSLCAAIFFRGAAGQQETIAAVF